MNLYKIEIQGFKSFPEKVEINFESGVTGIVGPNGCGKSNVVDAVRWVIGEQKPSELRISKNTDLIFNGTEKRGSQSYCEVSLYLDNTKQFFPIETEDLVITRKLDRSGESTSYINGQKVPLKNVVDLFRDTGVGKEGYSIIGQGKITALMDSKPEDRRMIFEEAAGISKHKDRKRKTEAKLMRTRDNMTRLNDIMEEVALNLGPLENEAKDAVKMKDLKLTLKNDEIELYLFQCENSEQARTNAMAGINKINVELIKQQEELDELDKKYEKIFNEYNAIERKNTDLHAKILNLTVASEKARGQINLLHSELKHASDSLENLKKAYDQNKQSLANYSKESLALLQKKAEKEELLVIKKEQLGLVEKEYEDLVKTVTEQEESIEVTQKLLLEQSDKRGEINKLVASYEIEVNLIEQTIVELQNKLKNLKKEINDIEENIQIYNKEKESCLREENEKKQEKEQIRLKYIDNQINLKNFTDRKNQLSKDRTGFEFRRETILEFTKTYASYDSAVQGLMLLKKSDSRVSKAIIGTFAEVISVPKEYVIAIEVALGNALQNIVTVDEYATNDLISVLKRDNLGRATFLPITTVKAHPLSREYMGVLSEKGIIGCATELIQYESRFSSIVSSFLGRTIIAENKEVALNVAKKYNFAFRIITLEGEAFLPSGAISGGSFKTKSRFLSNENDLEEIEKKLKKIDKDIKETDMLIEEYESESEELSKYEGVLQARLFQIEKDLVERKGRIDNSQQLLDDAIEEKKALENDIEEKKARVEDLHVLLKNTAGSNDLSNESITTEDYINEIRNKLFTDRQKRDEKLREMTTVKGDCSHIEVVINNTENNLSILNKSYINTEQEQNEISVKMLALAAQIEKYQKDLDISDFPEEDKIKLEEMRKELESLIKTREDLGVLLASLTSSRNEKNKEVTTLIEKKAKEESSLEVLLIEINSMSEKIFESYGYDYEGAKDYWIKTGKVFSKNFDTVKSLDKILKVRRAIERMGPVNELAEQKYEEESQRYAEMKQQFEDLSKAEEDLKNIIIELTRDMEKKFLENFKIINENFKVTFTDLFGGGSASLQLEKNVSPLIAGIEIHPRPPGKKLPSMALLSGGERDLTAIALLFAITKLSPMPFSLLDEIDAALDDTNARLFVQYLQRFSSESQFIVVTHRKPTMTLCDTLYGVTMQEKGVSKLVKVRLEEAERQIKEAGESI